MIKIAQIGTSDNSHGNCIWETLKKLPDIFEIVGYALPEKEREKFPNRMESFEGYREMTVEEILADPEIQAVTVETEEIYLTKYAIMAAKAGKHIHMEKPGGRELADFEELIRILKEKQLTFSVGYMYRFNPKIMEAMEEIRRGDLGEIYAVEAHMDCKHSPEVRQWLENFPGGIFFFLGCHLLDLIYRIQGEPAEVIPLNCATGFDGVNTQDYGMVVLKYPHGVSFAKTCGSEHGGFLRRQLVICGSKGTIELKPLEVYVGEEIYTVVHKSPKENDWHKPWTTIKTDTFDRYMAMMRHFAAVIQKKKENPYTYEYELGLYKLLLKACGEGIKQ